MRKRADILADMAQPVAPEFIETKTLKGRDISYIPVHNYVYLLNKIVGAGNWRWEITQMISYSQRVGDEEKSKLIVSGRLTIYSADSEPIWMDGLGSEDGIVESYGDPSSNAEAQALRRAARMFGLGLELWRENPLGERPLSAREQALKNMIEGLDASANWQEVVATLLPKNLPLAALSDTQYQALFDVLEASLHPVTGRALQEVWAERGLSKVSDRHKFLKALWREKGRCFDLQALHQLRETVA